MEESISMLDQIAKTFQTGEVDIRTYSPLTLAYIGDCVYELVIRTLIMKHGNQSVNNMSKIKVFYVKAETQAKMAEVLMNSMTEEEQSIYRRGKNAKTNTMSKSSTSADYHKATGMEAVIGYLYLMNQQNRLVELMKTGLIAVDGGNLWK